MQSLAEVRQQPYYQVYRLTGGLLYLSGIKGSAGHFRPVLLIAAAMLQFFPPALWFLFLPALSLVPVSTLGSCLPALGFFFISDSWLLSAQQGPWYLSSQHGSHCWPALPCSGLAPEHGLPHVMVQESATDQTPSPPANLRQIVTCLISGPTAPFILVFSAGYNHELDTPGKQYLHICCSIIIGSNRERSLPVFL